MIMRFLSILVISFLLSGNAYSKIIELKKCDRGTFKYNPKYFDKRSFIIDTSKSTVQLVTILTESQYKKDEKEFIKEFGSTRGLERISTINYEIEFVDNKFVKATKDWKSSRDPDLVSTIEIDLKKKVVFMRIHKNHTHRSKHQCK